MNFHLLKRTPYEFGSHWLNQDHDLVMRTYVGKTDEQMKALQLDPQQTKSIESHERPFICSSLSNPQKINYTSRKHISIVLTRQNQNYLTVLNILMNDNNLI